MAFRNRTVPDDDHGIRRFVYTVSRNIAKDPAVFGFTPADAVLLVDLADELIAKYITATRPDTRTRPVIRAKDVCRKKTLEVFRSYLRQVNANPSISDSEKSRLGIARVDRRKSPIPPPLAGPIMYMTDSGVGTHTIGYWDKFSMTRRAKPHGVSHLILLCAVDDQPIGDWNQARFLGAYTRNRIRVQHTPVDAGKTATYFAAWITGAGGQSTWSAPVSMTITAAGPGAVRQRDGELKIAA